MISKASFTSGTTRRGFSGLWICSDSHPPRDLNSCSAMRTHCCSSSVNLTPLKICTVNDAIHVSIWDWNIIQLYIYNIYGIAVMVIHYILRRDTDFFVSYYLWHMSTAQQHTHRGEESAARLYGTGSKLLIKRNFLTSQNISR